MTHAEETNETIEKAVSGDRAALERLLLDHYSTLAEHLAKRLPATIQSTVGVDDIVQQTYAQVFSSIASYERREGVEFSAWLSVIADNRLRDAIRAHKRKKRGGQFARINSVWDDQQGQAAKLLDAIAGPRNTASRSLARREAILAIRVALAGLPEDYRRTVQLRYFDGYSLEEIAAMMGRTQGAVRGLLDRARKKMRDTLERASHYLSSR